MDGLWTIEFGSSAGMFGSGVAVFREGRILGGDATYYYVGEYAEKGDTFAASLTISPFLEGAPSVFRTVGQVITLELSGIVAADGNATAKGQPKGMPELRFGAKLTRRA